jgi:ABC-type transport system substrate-binding protein
MDRRDWLAGSAALALWPAARGQPQPRTGGTLRVAFNVAETGFDPPMVGDGNSAYVISSIFEAPLTYDYLARPIKLKPQTAVDLPEIASDFRSFTFRIRPGIFFADDPVFKGKPRELVAQDYVYSVKRYFDPKLNSEHTYLYETAKLLGMNELRERALKSKKPFDYDTEVEGLRALDRYTFRVRTAVPSPRLHFLFASPNFSGALAREVVEHYGDDIAAHPVGTGPFKLHSWRRASRIELVRNPGFREQIFAAEPARGDLQAEEIARQLAGKRLPLVERVDISVITEAQPRWLAFLNGQLDLLELPTDFAPIAVPQGKVAPHLARRGVRLQRALQPDMVMTFFNLDHPMVGGYAPDKVALRRAVALAMDNDEYVDRVLRKQGIPAQSVIPPFTSGYDADYRSTMSEFSRARAKALLDMHGYIDRDGDGWRERPDGSPLVLRRASPPDQNSRNTNEIWRKSMTAIGVRIAFDIATWPDLLKMSRAGSMMMWGFVWSASTPDGGFFLSIGYGPNKGESNDSRFALPAFDRLFERQNVLPDGPERMALMQEGKNLLVAHMPYKVHAHRIINDLAQPGVRGYWRHPFMRDLWRYTGVDASPA